MGRIVAVALALAVVTTALPPDPTLGADSAIEVLQAGWGDLVVLDAWAPIRLRVTSATDAPDASVEVVVSTSYRRTPDSDPVTTPLVGYTQNVGLQAATPADLTFWVVTANASVADVHLRDHGQTVAAAHVDFAFPQGAPSSSLIGVLSPSPSLARDLAGLSPLPAAPSLPQSGLPTFGYPSQSTITNNGGTQNSVPITAADLPDDAARLSAFGALIVDGPVASLTDAQRLAIREWVSDGGQLVLLASADSVPNDLLLPADLPVQIGGEDSAADLGPLISWMRPFAPSFPSPPPPPPSAVTGPVVRLTVNTGIVLAGSAQAPLVWQQAIGDGSAIIVAAYAPTGRSDLSRLVLQAVARALAPNGSPGPSMLSNARARGQQTTSSLQTLATQTPADALPAWSAIGIILGAFALIAGPALALILRRLNRREAAWLVVPGLAIVLALLLVAVGIGRGGDTLENVVAAVRIDPARGTGRETLGVGFYAPMTGTLRAQVAGSPAIRATSAYPYGSSASSSEPPLRFSVGATTGVELDSSQFGMRTVTLDRHVTGQVGSIAADLRVDGAAIVGSIRNDTPYQIEDAGVIARESVARIGLLAPGQTATVRLTPVASSAQAQPASSLVAKMFSSDDDSIPPSPISATTGYYYYSPIGARSTGYESVRRMQLAAAALPGANLGPSTSPIALEFVGFTRSPVGGAQPTAGDHPTHSLTTITQPLKLSLQPGPFAIPSGMVPATAHGVGGYAGYAPGGTAVYGGTTTMRFVLPMTSSTRVDRISITTQQLGETTHTFPPRPTTPGGTPEPQAADAGVFSIYNGETGGWEPLSNGVDEKRTLEPAAPYVDALGVVKVQIKVETGVYLRYITPEIAVEGDAGS